MSTQNHIDNVEPIEVEVIDSLIRPTVVSVLEAGNCGILMSGQEIFEGADQAVEVENQLVELCATHGIGLRKIIINPYTVIVTTSSGNSSFFLIYAFADARGWTIDELSAT